MFPSIAIGIYVRDTFLLSNCLGLHNPFWTYGCFYSWIYFLIVYSARILGEFHPIHLDLSPTTDSLHRFVATANHLSMDYPLLTLPLRDREVTTNFTIRFITHNNAYCFMVSTHIDLRSMLRLVSHHATCFSGTVGTRTPDVIAHTYKVVFISSTSWEHQFC